MIQPGYQIRFVIPVPGGKVIFVVTVIVEQLVEFMVVRKCFLQIDMRQRQHRAVCTVADAADTARRLRDIAARGDMVICLGAGDITKWAAGLADAIHEARLAR